MIFLLDFVPWVLLSIVCVVQSSPIPPSPLPLPRGPKVIPPSTTRDLSPITIPPGCFYESKFFPSGSEIHYGYDEEENWCWWTYCNEDGNVIAADTPHCKTIQSPPTATPAEEEVSKGLFLNNIIFKFRLFKNLGHSD